MIFRRIRKRLPTVQSVQENRYLKPLGRYLHHHFLWQFNRKSVAGGVSVGLFFGILIPFAQIIVAAIAAIAFRVNMPVAMFSTLVTNPFTFPPIYYLAYKIGGFVTSWYSGKPEPQLPVGEAEQILAMQAEVGNWLTNLADWIQGVGFPLAVGLLILATTTAVIGYFAVSGLWRLHAIRRWKNRAGNQNLR